MIPQLRLSKEEADAWRPELPFCDNWDVLSFYSAILPRLGPSPAIAEIGVLYGRSLLYLAYSCLASGCQQAHLYGIDPLGRPWLRDGSGGTVVSPLEALRALTEYGTDAELRLIQLVQLESVAASVAFGDRAFDLVMIDGDHSYDGVIEDIDHWLPKIRAGGVLAGHDFGHQYPGVKRAVRERFQMRPTIQGRVWAIEVQ